jgi:N-acetylmuramoyl-L-alanine amidase
MPSILIELGFINNQSEANFLSTKRGQQTMASAIYSGFKKYKREFDKKQGKFVVADNEDDFSFDTKDTADVGNTNDEQPVSNITQEQKKADLTGKVEYRVQFLISMKKLSQNSSSFKGLSPVTFYKDESGYKYTYGSTTSLKEIVDIQHQVKTKFKDAFIVKFKDGERIK